MISHFSLERSKKKVRRSSQRWQPGAGFSLAETITIKKEATCNSFFKVLISLREISPVSWKQIIEDVLQTCFSEANPGGPSVNADRKIICQFLTGLSGKQGMLACRSSSEA